MNNGSSALHLRILISVYLLTNALLFGGISITLWILWGRARDHKIPPGTTLGFRSQETLASAKAWYAAQDIAFQFAAIGTTAVTLAVVATMAAGQIRRWSMFWSLVIPVGGWLAVAVCVLLAGWQADAMATAIVPNS